MSAVIEDLKQRARSLHRLAQERDALAVRRLRRLPELKKLEEATLAETVLRRHCLSVVARELGFNGWSHATAMARGETLQDHGTLLVPHRVGGFQNNWSADHTEAAANREANGGWLLGYKRHFLVVEGAYIDALGLDPADPDWALIGWDWTRPAAPEARTRLLARLLGVEPARA